MTQLNVACHRIAHGRLSGALLGALSSGKTQKQGRLAPGGLM